MPNRYITSALFLLLIATGAGGYWKGHHDATIAQKAAIKTATVRSQVAENNLRLAQQALEDQAHAQPPTAGCGLPRSRVLRLDQNPAVQPAN